MNGSPADTAPGRVDVSLLSHTNVGKTTLARTLLRQDIGAVGDRPHVTEVAECHVLIETTLGDTLVLWDTPGFGDSVRVLRRLRSEGRPVGWFLSHLWDRATDRPFWCSQQAMRNAREQTDVILYVVNAGEPPSAAGFIAAEMGLLAWTGKPAIVLLNQLGPSADPQQTEADVARWRGEMTQYPWVAGVLPFDAFARCWVQEGTLLGHVQKALPPAGRAAGERLFEAWRERNLDVFQRSMQALAAQLAASAADSEPLAATDISGKARAWLGAVASGAEPTDAGLQSGQAALASRLEVRVRQTTAELVTLHGLSGRATLEVLQWLGTEFSVDRPADADKVSVLGGLVSGALGGLAADLGAGGLTFGAGAIIGGVLGAFGARGLARAYNLARGSDTGTVRWSAQFMTVRVAAALARYLAIAHFGRGRGDFVAATPPAHWQQAIAVVLSRRREELTEVFASDPAPPDRAATLAPLLTSSARDVLLQLYPDVSDVFE